MTDGGARRNGPWWRDGWSLFALGAGFVTCALAVCLALGIETVQRQPAWFWALRSKHLLVPALVMAAAFGSLLCTVFLRPWPIGRRAFVRMAVLVVLGYAWQQGLALAEGRGAEGMRARALNSGHREFVRTASANLDARKVFVNYERMVRELPYQEFARSKPPGHLLVYMAMARIAVPIMPHLWNPPRAEPWSAAEWSLANWLVLVLPLSTYLVFLPLVGLGRLLLPATVAGWPALLFLAAPVTALVTLHLDGALYPLVAVTMWWCAARGARSAGPRAWIWWALAGAGAWIALFLSFSLLAALPLAVLFAVLSSAARPEGGLALRRVLAGVGVAAGTCLLFFAVARLAAGYDVRVAYERALFNHRDGKGWREADRFPAAGWTLTEFAYWLGPAFLGLFLGEVAFAARRLARAPRAAWRGAILPLGVLAMVVAVALLGSTYAEVARIWIFLIPAVALAAAPRLVHAPPRAVRIVLALQILWTVALKNWQDF